MGWAHSPSQRVSGPGLYIVTASTYNKAHYFASKERLDFLQEKLFESAILAEWELQAWSLFSNHYHLVGICNNPGGVKVLTERLHAVTTQFVNRLDGTPGRKAWFNCWDTQITNEKSYLARLAYVHNNSMKHLAVRPEDYPYCSLNWFRDKADKSFFDTVMSFKTDRVSVYDDFEPLDER